MFELIKIVNPAFEQLACTEALTHFKAQEEFKYYLQVLLQAGTFPDPFILDFSNVPPGAEFNIQHLESLISTLAQAKNIPQRLEIYSNATNSLKDEDLHVLGKLFALKQCPKALYVDFGESALSGISLCHFSRALLSAPKQEGSLEINLSNSCKQESWDLGLEALIALLQSGACPPDFSMDMSANKIKEGMLTKLFEVLAHEHCPKKLGLSTSGLIFAEENRKVLTDFLVGKEGCLELRLELTELFLHDFDTIRDHLQWLIDLPQQVSLYPHRKLILLLNDFEQYEYTTHFKPSKALLQTLVKHNPIVVIEADYFNEDTFISEEAFKCDWGIVCYSARNMALSAPHIEDRTLVASWFEHLLAYPELELYLYTDDQYPYEEPKRMFMINLLSELFQDSTQIGHYHYHFPVHETLFEAKVISLLSDIFRRLKQYPKKIFFDLMFHNAGRELLSNLCSELQKAHYPQNINLRVRPNFSPESKEDISASFEHVLDFTSTVMQRYETLELDFQARLKIGRRDLFIRIEHTLQIGAGPEKFSLNFCVDEESMNANYDQKILELMIARSQAEPAYKQLSLIATQILIHLSHPLEPHVNYYGKVIPNFLLYLHHVSTEQKIQISFKHNSWRYLSIFVKQQLIQILCEKPNIITAIQNIDPEIAGVKIASIDPPRPPGAVEAFLDQVRESLNERNQWLFTYPDYKLLILRCYHQALPEALKSKFNQQVVANNLAFMPEPLKQRTAFELFRRNNNVPGDLCYGLPEDLVIYLNNLTQRLEALASIQPEKVSLVFYGHPSIIQPRLIPVSSFQALPETTCSSMHLF